MTQEEFSLLFHRSQVNLVAFKMLYEPVAFEAMHRMVEMAIAEEREACAKTVEKIETYEKIEKDCFKFAAKKIRARGKV